MQPTTVPRRPPRPAPARPPPASRRPRHGGPPGRPSQLTSGAYDEVADLDRVLADPADPDRPLPGYDSGDHPHPSDTGCRAMAEAIDTGAR